MELKEFKEQLNKFTEEFYKDWVENYCNAGEHIYPLTLPNFSEWFEHFLFFIQRKYE